MLPFVCTAHWDKIVAPLPHWIVLVTPVSLASIPVPGSSVKCLHPNLAEASPTSLFHVKHYLCSVSKGWVILKVAIWTIAVSSQLLVDECLFSAQRTNEYIKEWEWTVGHVTKKMQHHFFCLHKVVTLRSSAVLFHLSFRRKIFIW